MNETENKNELNNKTASFLLMILFLTLPFERILTFEIAGFTVKPPYLAGIFLICYLVYCLVFKKKKLIIRNYDYVALAFIISSYLTFFWSIDQKKTLIISSMFLFVYLIFLSVKTLIEPKKIDLYINIFIWLGVACSVFALFQFFGDSYGLSQNITGLADLYTKRVFGYPRVQATFFEPGFFANFLLIAVFANMSKLSSKSIKYYLSFTPIFTAFVLTLSRGGFYAFIVAYIVAAILILVKAREKLIFIYRSLVFMAISILIAMASILFVSGSQGLHNFSNQSSNTRDLVVGSSQESVQNFTRNATIKIALLNWQKHIFGIGTGAFGSLSEFKQTRETGNQRQTVNSLYPEILVEGGFQSLVLFLLFLGLIFFNLLGLFFSKKGTRTLFFAAALLSVFIQYLSFSTLYLIYVWVFLGIIVAYIEDSQDLKMDHEPNEPRK